MKKLLLCILVLSFSSTRAQNEIDLKPTFVHNKLVVIDITLNDVSKMKSTMDREKGLGDWRPKFEMKTIVYDSSIAEHKKLLKKLDFQQKDTIVIMDWDLGESTTSHCLTACKLKHNVKDSILVFYHCQDIERHYDLKKASRSVRTFKVSSINKIGFVIQDMDYTEVKRMYRFKAIKNK